nr:reverse transcriptase domain-containing protein [Tanacetum cinerariifolium]
MRTRSSSNRILESSRIPKRRNRRRSNRIVEPELRTIVETPVATMADNHTMEEMLQAPTEGFGDAIVKFKETFGEAWERFKEMLRQCPHHGFLELHQIDTFYNGLNEHEQDSLNAAAGGNLLISSNVSTTSSDSSSSTDARIDKLTYTISNLVETINKKMTSPAMVKAIKETCVICGGAHPYYDCIPIDSNTSSACAATEVEQEPEATKGNVQFTSSESTAQIHPSVVPIPILEPKVVLKPNLKPSIPYPSRLNKEKLQDKSDIQIHKFLQIFKKLYFNISLAEALALMPKYHKMLKDLLSDKEKLLRLENTSLTENCSAILLKKLPEKLRDPVRFLIPCDFQGLESCMARADLGASINLMPLSVWNKLYLPKLTPTRMTLELATRSIAYPIGIAEDVCVQVGKFTFPVDFVVVNYDVNPCVLIILGRPFLRTTRALVDVHRDELILRDDDEKLIFHADNTSKHPHMHESINLINFIDITCEDHFLKVLKINKSNHPSSGSTTPLSDSLPSLTPFETSDSLLEEFADELALLNPFPPGNKDDNFDFEADLREIEYLLNQDPSTESSPKYDIDIINPVFERFTDEPGLVYSPPPGEDNDDDDDLFNLKSDNDEWKKIFDPTLPEESSEIATLTPSPFRNEDKMFNPDILSLGETKFFNDESKDKDLTLEEQNFSDQELFFHLELTVIETLLSFSSKIKDKVFNPRILTSKGVQYFTLGLSHRTYETFKIVNIHPNIFNKGPKMIFSFFCSAPRTKIFPDLEASRARGFVLHSLKLQSLAYGNPIS